MTQLVEDSLEEAKELAIAHRNYQLDIPHLWTILVKPDQFAFQFYQSLEINTNQLIEVINKEIDKIPSPFKYRKKQLCTFIQSAFKNSWMTRIEEMIDLKDQVLDCRTLDRWRTFNQQRNPI